MREPAPVCNIGGCRGGCPVAGIWAIGWRETPVMELRREALSEAAGEKAEPVLLGELEWEDGVGRFFGEAAVWWGCKGGGKAPPGSPLGAMLELDLRD